MIRLFVLSIIVGWALAYDVDFSKPVGLQLPTARRSPAVAGVIDGSGAPLMVVAGGAIDFQTATDELLLFDLLKNTKQTFRMPERRDEPVIGVLNDLVLIASGNNGTGYSYRNISATVDMFDVTKRKFLPAAKISPRRYMTVSCTAYVCAFIGGRGLVNDEVEVSRTVDAYDIRTNSWTSFTIRAARYSIASVAVGEKIFITGGDLDFGKRVFDVEVIDFGDPNSGSWVSVVDGPIPYSMFSHSGARAGGVPVFAGGIRRGNDASAPNNGEQPLNTCLMKLSPSSSWSKQSFGGATFTSTELIYEMAGVSLGEHALFVGGTRTFLGTNGSNFLYSFESTTRQWSRLQFDNGPPISHRGVGAVTFGSNAFVVAAGGQFNNADFATTVVVMTFSNDPTINSTCANCADGRCVAPQRCVRATTIARPPDTPNGLTPPPATTDDATASSTASDVATTVVTKQASGGDDNSTLLPTVIGAVVGLLLIGGIVVMVVLFVRRRNRLGEMSTSNEIAASNTISMQPTAPTMNTGYISQGYSPATSDDGSSAGYQTTGSGYQVVLCRPPTTQYGSLQPRSNPKF